MVLAMAAAMVGALAQTAPATSPSNIAGTSWRLVGFQGGDGKTLTPDDRTKYTFEFGTDGALNARIDCNRGRGAWKSGAAGELEVGALALTRAQCPPGSLHDQIVKQLPFIRSYVVKNGHLFLSLMADGGIYELEPMTGTNPPSSGTTVASTGPFAFACTRTGGAPDSLTATFYQTQPAMVLVERGGQSRPAFQVIAASGAKYEGKDLMFWEA